jgi:thiamine-monophosphate kinase
MGEFDIIRTITSHFARSPQQLNGPFECDSELFDFDGAKLAISVDEYTEAEDFFSSFFPKTLGQNLAIATLSDLLAAGSEPVFFLHSMTLPRTQEEEFAKELSLGISGVLQNANCHLLGGDLGVGDTWRYVGVAIGRRHREIYRRGARPGNILYSTGLLGAGNRQALMMFFLQQGRISNSREMSELASPQFFHRKEHAQIAWKYAKFMMDTSDGLFLTAKSLCELAPGCCFVVENPSKLLEPQCCKISEEFGVPPIAFLLASAGEYELVFGIDAQDEKAMLQEAAVAGLSFMRVGRVEGGEGIALDCGEGQIDIGESAFPDPRFGTVQRYFEQICNSAAALGKRL